MKQKANSLGDLTKDSRSPTTEWRAEADFRVYLASRFNIGGHYSVKVTDLGPFHFIEHN